LFFANVSAPGLEPPPLVMRDIASNPQNHASPCGRTVIAKSTIGQNWLISRFLPKSRFKRTHSGNPAQPDGLLLGAGKRRPRCRHGWRFPNPDLEDDFMKRALMNRLMMFVAAVCLSMGGLQLQASACGGCGGCGCSLGQLFRHCCCTSSCGSCSSCSSCGSSTEPSCGCQKEEPSCGAPAEGAAPAAPATTPAPAAPAKGPSA
jgi:hypothetical protein